MLQSLLEALDREKLGTHLRKTSSAPILAFSEAIATIVPSWLCEAYSKLHRNLVDVGPLDVNKLSEETFTLWL